jgi:Ribbon-helix-helix protein, copG family
MAAKSENTGTVLQSWVTPKFAREIRELAENDGRSVSNLIRFALRERLQASPIGEGAHRGGDSSPRAPRRGASASREES